MNSQAHGTRHLHAALVLTAIFALVELAAGWLANSLALLADAAHMASDIVALGLAVVAGRIAGRPAHAGMTYGYGRARVLAALANGLGLWFLAGWIFWEAVGRLASPPAVNGMMVVFVAVAGLLVNVVILGWLGGSHDLNTRRLLACDRRCPRFGGRHCRRPGDHVQRLDADRPAALLPGGRHPGLGRPAPLARNDP